jgi:uncharacterized membrane protein YphA (DoxX/SURF4 family)
VTDETRTGWRAFWFEPTSTATLALFRIALGLLLVAWTISLGPDLGAFFTGHGLHAPPNSHGWLWNLFEPFGDGAAVYAVWALLLVASVCVTLGLFTRVAAAVAFLAVLSFERQNEFVFNSGDFLIRNLCFYLALAPAGAAVSLDRLRRFRGAEFWQFPLRAPWAMRLIQIQLSVVYLATVWAKLRGDTWNNGTAVSYALRVGDLMRLHVPTAITGSLLLSNLLTFGTLFTEACIGVLVWNRRARPWVLLAGVSLHIGIELTLDVGFFSLAMFVLYLSFVSPETSAAVIRSAARRLGVWREPDVSSRRVRAASGSSTRRGRRRTAVAARRG